MTYKLNNATYAVAVNEHGAELSSFKNTVTNLEYIWQADPAVWARHAPVLFPIVGKLRNGEYHFGGQTYKLPQHGIARDLNFRLEEQTSNSLTFALNSSDRTLAVYPFSFRLEIKYQLTENTLAIFYKVQNTGEEHMLFSLGAHPAFNCPLLPGEAFTDYYLAFEKAETLSRYLLNEGLQNGQTEPVLTNQEKLPLQYELFEKDAIVLKGLTSEKITLQTNKHAHGLTFEFKGFPYFGIWTKERNAPFICLEPWHGIASHVDDSGELTEKEGIMNLPPGETFTCSYTIRVF